MTPSMVLNRYGGAGITEVVTDTYKDDEGQYKPMNFLRERALQVISKAAGEDSVPKSVLRGVVERQRRAIQEDQAGENQETATAGRWTVTAMVGAAARFAMRAATAIASWVLRAAKSLIWTVGRVILRAIVMPVLSGLGAILTSPVGLGVGAVLGAGALGYFLYRSFFKGDDPKTVDKGGEGFTSEDDSEASFWGRIFGASPTRASVGGGTSQYGVGATAERMGYTGGVASEKETANAEKILQTKRSATVAGAIKEASRVTGVDESILNAIAYKESTFNPNAKAPTSTAKGLFQFLDGTWKGVLNQYGARYGVPKDASPYDPLSAAIMGGVYLKHEIYPQIAKVRPNPNATDLYMGHFMGPVGGRNWLRNMMNNPNAIAANDFPQ
ncbi:MAG: transglycosylase SLT domain-containing protein, partial [Pseudomonadales bacterium]